MHDVSLVLPFLPCWLMRCGNSVGVFHSVMKDIHDTINPFLPPSPFWLGLGITANTQTVVLVTSKTCLNEHHLLGLANKSQLMRRHCWASRVQVIQLSGLLIWPLLSWIQRGFMYFIIHVVGYENWSSLIVLVMFYLYHMAFYETKIVPGMRAKIVILHDNPQLILSVCIAVVYKSVK